MLLSKATNSNSCFHTLNGCHASRSSLKFSISLKDTSTCRTGELNQWPSDSKTGALLWSTTLKYKCIGLFETALRWDFINLSYEHVKLDSCGTSPVFNEKCNALSIVPQSLHIRCLSNEVPKINNSHYSLQMDHDVDTSLELFKN